MKYQQWSIPELPAGGSGPAHRGRVPLSGVLGAGLPGITTPEEAAAFLERDRDLPYSPF